MLLITLAYKRLTHWQMDISILINFVNSYQKKFRSPDLHNYTDDVM